MYYVLETAVAAAGDCPREPTVLIYIIRKNKIVKYTHIYMCVYPFVRRASYVKHVFQCYVKLSRIMKVL